MDVTALDVEQINKLFRLLLDLRARGIGMLLVTHLLDLASGILKSGEGDEIVFLDHGEVLEVGGIDILKNPSHLRVKEFISLMKYAT